MISVQGSLLVILFLLMVLVGKGRGIKTFFTLGFNLFTLFFFLELIALGLNPIKVTFLGSTVISSITLFYINGFNKKTVSSLLAIMIVVTITLLATYTIGIDANIQGFSHEQSESIAYLTVDPRMNFIQIVICEILFGLLGGIIDVAISISSAMNEIHKNNSLITRNGLFSSGIAIGKDILGTMTNTLLFAYISGFMTLLIWFNQLKYSISEILNAKVFCAELIQVLCCGVGIILIIPITAAISSVILFIPRKG